MKRNEAAYEKAKQEITAHFKKEKRKAAIIWVVFEVAAVALDFFLTKLIFGVNFLQWFLVALFFIVVFPTTLLSKKLKELSRSQNEQIKLSETNF